MQYHPIMGIAVFALSVGLAYLVGRRWAARRAAGALRPAQAADSAAVPEKDPAEGDALAPDAPWVEREEGA